MAALLGVPLEGRPVVTHIVREVCHVVGNVREAQDMIAYQTAGGRVAEAPLVVSRSEFRR